MTKLEGIIPAVITPLKDDEIDYYATTTHVNILIEEGVDGLFILGTNGEFHVLSDDEKVSFAKHVIDVVAKRVPVYVGVGSCSTRGTLELAKRMEQLHPDALSVITPYMVPVSQSSLIEHYTTIANNVTIPLILYNIPANTGNNIDPSTVEMLMSHPNIIGIKDSSGNIELLKEYIDVSRNENFSVLVGSDSKILDAYILGAKGCVASTANIITPHIKLLIQSFKNNDLTLASKLQIDIDPIRNVMKKESIPVILKRLVSLKNVEVGEARKPAPTIGDKYDTLIEEVLNFYN